MDSSFGSQCWAWNWFVINVINFELKDSQRPKEKKKQNESGGELIVSVPISGNATDNGPLFIVPYNSRLWSWWWRLSPAPRSSPRRSRRNAEFIHTEREPTAMIRDSTRAVSVNESNDFKDETICFLRNGWNSFAGISGLQQWLHVRQRLQQRLQQFGIQ